MGISKIDKVSQMFIIHYKHKYEFKNIIALIKKYPIGGVIIGNNTFSTIEELENIISELIYQSKSNLLIGINKLPNEFAIFPSLSSMQKKGLDTVKKYAYTYSEVFSYLGINLYLGPNLNLNQKKYNCGFHSNPRRVCECYDEIVPAHKKYGIMSIPNSFPGIGSIDLDSYFTKRVKKYPTKDITPFEHALKKGVDGMLLANVIVKGTKLKPITECKGFIQNLKEEYKYEGLLIAEKSDTFLSFGSIKRKYKAGIDMQIVPYSKTLELTIKQLSKVENKELNNLYNRIMIAKEKFAKNNMSFEKININKFNSQVNKIK